MFFLHLQKSSLETQGRYPQETWRMMSELAKSAGDDPQLAEERAILYKHGIEFHATQRQQK